jgi:hypothetical protein
MKYKEPEAMREIHEIRLKLYEDNKGLSAIEKAERANEAAAEIIKKYKLKIKLLKRAKSHTEQAA